MMRHTHVALYFIVAIYIEFCRTFQKIAEFYQSKHNKILQAP